jgi:hypothetical protein
MGPNSVDLRPCRTIRVALVTASIVAGQLVLTAAHGLGIEADFSKPTSQEAEEVVSTEARDRAYDDLRTDVERLVSVWEQQPNNRAALQRYAEAIKAQAGSLKELAAGEGAEAAELKVSSGVIGEPAGPAAPSKEPSSEEQMERRRRATEDRFLKGPALSRRPATLADVSGGWIVESCGQAVEDIDQIIRLLDSPTVDTQRFEGALEKLRNTVAGMTSPPATEGQNSTDDPE